jgi:hypothetical protein
MTYTKERPNVRNTDSNHQNRGRTYEQDMLLRQRFERERLQRKGYQTAKQRIIQTWNDTGNHNTDPLEQVVPNKLDLYEPQYVTSTGEYITPRKALLRSMKQVENAQAIEGSRYTMDARHMQSRNRNNAQKKLESMRHRHLGQGFRAQQEAGKGAEQTSNSQTNSVPVYNKVLTKAEKPANRSWLSRFRNNIALGNRPKRIKPIPSIPSHTNHKIYVSDAMHFLRTRLQKITNHLPHPKNIFKHWELKLTVGAPLVFMAHSIGMNSGLYSSLNKAYQTITNRPIETIELSQDSTLNRTIFVRDSRQMIYRISFTPRFENGSLHVSARAETVTQFSYSSSNSDRIAILGDGTLATHQRVYDVSADQTISIKIKTPSKHQNPPLEQVVSVPLTVSQDFVFEIPETSQFDIAETTIQVLRN